VRGVQRGLRNSFGYKLREELTGAGLLTPKTVHPTTPFSRAFLVSNGVLSLDDAEHNELGFEQAFRVLTQADITHDLLGNGLGKTKGRHAYATTWSGPRCTAPNVPKGLGTLSTALKVIGDANDQFDVRGTERPSLDQVFARADERLSAFDEWAAAFSVQIVNTDSDDEPHELYGCSPTAGTWDPPSGRSTRRRCLGDPSPAALPERGLSEPPGQPAASMVTTPVCVRRWAVPARSRWMSPTLVS
jgi:hypothetical protein